jgi:Ca2+:H+ antiporter
MPPPGAHILNRWFGLILLPLVSFSADGFVCIMFFVHYIFRAMLGKPKPPAALAKARSIDLSIQFLLFWLPVLILLGWATGRPVHMLFGVYLFFRLLIRIQTNKSTDYLEVAVLLAACFLVNYVTADAKTNWAEVHTFPTSDPPMLILLTTGLHLTFPVLYCGM